MNIAKFEEAIINCRFCFMCRHLSGISNVTSQEADTPRVRAAAYYAVLRGFAPIDDPELIAHVYQSDLSRACCHHCCQYKRANHDDRNFDENGMTLAFRQDIVEAGLAPAKVKELAAGFDQAAAPKISGKGDVLYYIDADTAAVPAISKAFETVLKKAGVEFRTANGGCTGKELRVLGFVKEAKAAAEKFVAAINAAKVKTVVVSSPALYDALTNDLAEYGVKLAAKVMHTSEFIVGLKLKFAKKAGRVYFLESDFLKNYCNEYPAAHKLLAALKADLTPFGTNSEESYTCGEGAMLLPELDDELVDKLASYIVERADAPASDVIVTASPYTRRQLAKRTKLKVVSLEELAAKNL